jgi:hypothetical protein
MLSSSDRSRSQIVRKASAVALSSMFCGQGLEPGLIFVLEVP